jgi:hypothetical protein
MLGKSPRISSGFRLESVHIKAVQKPQRNHGRFPARLLNVSPSKSSMGGFQTAAAKPVNFDSFYVTKLAKSITKAMRNQIGRAKNGQKLCKLFELGRINFYSTQKFQNGFRKTDKRYQLIRTIHAFRESERSL